LFVGSMTIVTVSVSPVSSVAEPVSVGRGLIVISGFTVGDAGEVVSTDRVYADETGPSLPTASTAFAVNV
jgi:hypothetical protein